MDDDRHLVRTSLWSIPERWSGAYLWIFLSQTLIWLGLLIFNEAASAQSVNIVAQAVNVGIAWAPLMVVSAGTSMLIVEVTMVFADKILNLRYKRGREEGVLQERARWEQYLTELEDARKTGKPEPARPTASTNGSADR